MVRIHHLPPPPQRNTLPAAHELHFSRGDAECAGESNNLLRRDYPKEHTRLGEIDGERRRIAEGGGIIEPLSIRAHPAGIGHDLQMETIPRPGNCCRGFRAGFHQVQFRPGQSRQYSIGRIKAPGEARSGRRLDLREVTAGQSDTDYPKALAVGNGI